MHMVMIMIIMMMMIKILIIIMIMMMMMAGDYGFLGAPWCALWPVVPMPISCMFVLPKTKDDQKNINITNLSSNNR